MEVAGDRRGGPAVRAAVPTGKFDDRNTSLHCGLVVQEERKPRGDVGPGAVVLGSCEDARGRRVTLLTHLDDDPRIGQQVAEPLRVAHGAGVRRITISRSLSQ